MSNNQLTNKTMVLITRIGPVWVSRDRGESVMRLKEKHPDAVIEIDGNYYAAVTIYGLLSAQQYSDYQNEKRGMWQCSFMKWHNRNDVCACARDILNNKNHTEVEELTPEEKDKARLKLLQIKKSFFERKRK